MSAIAIILTQAERRQVLRDASSALAERLYAEASADGLKLLSKARAAGLLDVDPKTLDAMNIPRICLSGSKLVKYLPADIATFIASRRED